MMRNGPYVLMLCLLGGCLSSGAETSPEWGDEDIEKTASLIPFRWAPVLPAGGTCDPHAMPFGGGDGSRTSPFLICDVAHLNAISSSYKAKFYRLTQSLDLKNKTVLAHDLFNGFFEGGKHTLSNLEASPTGQGVWIRENRGVIQNLIIRDFKVKWGVIARTNAGHIHSIDATGDVVSGGGIVSSNAGSIVSVRFAGTVQRGGGIVYDNMQATARIAYAQFSGEVAGGVNEKCGGIAARNHGVIEYSHASGSVKDCVFIGGIAGRNGGLVRRVISDMYVEGSEYYVGHIAGITLGLITEAHARGKALRRVFYDETKEQPMQGVNPFGGTIDNSLLEGSSLPDIDDSDRRNCKGCLYVTAPDSTGAPTLGTFYFVDHVTVDPGLSQTGWVVLDQEGMREPQSFASFDSTIWDASASVLQHLGRPQLRWESNIPPPTFPTLRPVEFFRSFSGNSAAGGIEFQTANNDYITSVGVFRVTAFDSPFEFSVVWLEPGAGYTYRFRDNGGLVSDCDNKSFPLTVEAELTRITYSPPSGCNAVLPPAFVPAGQPL